jgi:hypothetical protein
MTFPVDLPETIVIQVTDPGADDKQRLVWKAPKACEVISATISVQAAQNAGSAGEYTLLNYGSAGTANEGTVVDVMGGTAVASRLAALTPVAGTINEGTLAEGDYVVLDYQETGDFVEEHVTIVLEVVYGIGA